MSTYKHILFDLDGTLTDSEPGIFACFRHALDYFGIKEESDKNLKKVIGPPLGVSFKEFYGLDGEKTDIAVEKYRERYTVNGIYENKLYNGIEEFLKELRLRGFTIMLATSKPDVFARRILSYFNIDQYFDFISAADLQQKTEGKEAIIKKAMEHTNDNNLSHFLMVGDRKFDILGAVNCGIDSIGVLYGYGDTEELTTAGATFLCKSPSDILKVID